MDGTSHYWVTNTVPVYDTIEEFNVDSTRNNNMKKEETKTNGVGSPLQKEPGRLWWKGFVEEEF